MNTPKINKTLKINKTFAPINTIDRPTIQRPEPRSIWQRPIIRRIIFLIGFLILIGVASLTVYNLLIRDDGQSPQDEVRQVLSHQSKFD